MTRGCPQASRAAIPADPSLSVSATEYGNRYAARVPVDGSYAERMGAYLDGVLPVYGEHFADWWRDRLVPEMLRNFAYRSTAEFSIKQVLE